MNNEQPQQLVPASKDLLEDSVEVNQDTGEVAFDTQSALEAMLGDPDTLEKLLKRVKSGIHRKEEAKAQRERDADKRKEKRRQATKARKQNRGK